MKFFVDDRHREFFREHRYIEFEGFIDDKKIADWFDALKKALAKKFGVLSIELQRQKQKELILQGKELWRDDPQLEKLLRTRSLGEVASEISGERPLRLGRDQLFIGSELPEIKSERLPLFIGEQSLEKATCYRGIACGVLIRLSGSSEPVEEVEDSEEEQRYTPLPREPGNCIYLHSTARVNFPAIIADPESSFLLITYITDQARYIFREADPHTHLDKKQGFGFGDRVREQLHPILYRG